MQFGLSTYFNTDESLDGVIDTIISAGLKAIELSYEPPHLFAMDDSFVEKARKLHEKGVEFSMHGPFLETNLGSYLEEIRLISRQRVLDAIRFASSLDADPVVVHPGYSFFHKLPDFNDMLKGRFIEDLKIIAEEAGRLGVRVALENIHMPYFFFNEISGFGGISGEVPGIGVTLDVGHAYISKCMKGHPEPEEAIIDDISLLGIERLFHVHLHNNNGAGDDHSIIGGSMDMGKILRGLRELNYRGKIIVETVDAEKYGIATVMDRLRQIISDVKTPATR